MGEVRKASIKRSQSDQANVQTSTTSERASKRSKPCGKARRPVRFPSHSHGSQKCGNEGGQHKRSQKYDPGLAAAHLLAPVNSRREIEASRLCVSASVSGKDVRPLPQHTTANRCLVWKPKALTSFMVA